MAYPTNTARAVFEFALPNGTAGYCTPHFRTQDATDMTLSDVGDLATALADWWSNDDFGGATNQAMRNYHVDDCTLQTITVTTLAAVTPFQSVVTVGLAGEQAVTPLPNETALVVTLYTGLVGRSYRGRNFWPGMPTNLMEANGTVAAASLAGLQTTFEALIDELPTVVPNITLAVNSVTLPAATPVIAAQVRDVLHHQRRRNS